MAGGRITENFAAGAARAAAYVDGLIPTATAPDLRRPRRIVKPTLALVMAELTSFPELEAPNGRRAATLAPAVTLRRDPRGAGWISLVGDVVGVDLLLEARLRGREETFEFGRFTPAQTLAEGLRGLGLTCDVHFGSRWRWRGWDYDPGRWLVTTAGPAWQRVGDGYGSPTATPRLDDLRVSVQRLGAPGPLPGVEIVPTALRPAGPIHVVSAPLTAPPGLPSVTAGSEAVIHRISQLDGWTVGAFDPHQFAGDGPRSALGTADEDRVGLNPFHFRPGVSWQLAAATAETGS